MKITNIQWRNIGPYGNKIQELQLDSNGALWMLLGKNGSGKSFILNLTKAIFFGKIDKLKKDEISNRFNKHGWGKIEGLLNDGLPYTVEREFSPSNLIAKKNDEDVGKAGITDYQTYIENEIVGLPYSIFSNVISLSVNDFKSFISMTPGDKRLIIDKIFSMEIINNIHELIKRDLKEYKIKLDLFDRDIQAFNFNIDKTKQELEKLIQKSKEDNTQKINELIKNIEAFKPKLEEVLKKREEYTLKKNELDLAVRTGNENISKVKFSIEQINKKIALFNQDKCPTCETLFSDGNFSLIKDNLESQKTEKTKELEDLTEVQKNLVLSRDKVNEAITKLNTVANQVQFNITNFNNQLKILNDNAINKDGLESLQNIISTNSIKLKEINDKKIVSSGDLKYLQILEMLYNNDGIKKKILENYLPTLNEEVEYTLSELHFPYNLHFTSDFDAELSHLGIKISADSLSTGEKKRVDLAAIISIIRMIKRKFPNINMLMLDEILSSIDSEGMYDFISYLQKTSKEMHLNIFIVNHTPLPVEYFDYKILVDKNDGFSDIIIEKLQ